MAHIDNMAHLGLVLCCFWSVLCRINFMGRGTRHSVFALYFILGMSLLGSLAVPTSPLLLGSLGVVAMCLAFSAKRWRGGQPLWTLSHRHQ